MQATIDKLVPGGQSIATLNDGKKAFIWNALPGETVDFDVTKSKRSYCEGIATKISNPNEHRIAPKDDCYLSTSPWQIMDYAYELEQKRALVKECFTQQHIDIDKPDHNARSFSDPAHRRQQQRPDLDGHDACFSSSCRRSIRLQ